MSCRDCGALVTGDLTITTVETAEQFRSLIYLPFPTRGESLEDVLKREFETERGIPFDCPNPNGTCGARSIGVKSKTQILQTCEMGLFVSVTRRHHRTQQRIPNPITINDHIVTLHQNTAYESSYQLIGAINHSVV